MLKKLNISLLNQKSAEIKQSLFVLREFKGMDKYDFLQNPEAVKSARKAFIILAEAATNIANHLCVRLLQEPPNFYTNSFLLLSEHQMLPKNLANRLAKIADFRTLLIRGYGKVDNKILFLKIGRDLDHFDLYLSEIERIIKDNEKSRGQA